MLKSSRPKIAIRSGAALTALVCVFSLTRRLEAGLSVSPEISGRGGSTIRPIHPPIILPTGGRHVSQGGSSSCPAVYFVFAGTCPLSGTLSCPDSLSRSLTSSCQDFLNHFNAEFFSFNATAGDTVTITMESSKFNVFLDAVGCDGSMGTVSITGLLENGTSSAKVVFPIKKTGKLFVEAGSTTVHGSPDTGPYTLEISGCTP